MNFHRYVRNIAMWANNRRLSAANAPSCSCRFRQRGRIVHHRIVDGKVQHRREQAGGGRGSPYQRIGAGHVEHETAEPRAQKRTELMAEKADAEERPKV